MGRYIIFISLALKILPGPACMSLTKKYSPSTKWPIRNHVMGKEVPGLQKPGLLTSLVHTLPIWKGRQDAFASLWGSSEGEMRSWEIVDTNVAGVPFVIMILIREHLHNG